MKVYLFFADLHIGGLIDFKAFDYCVNAVLTTINRFRTDNVIAVVLGDVVDGEKVYKSQITVEGGLYQPIIAATLFRRLQVVLGIKKYLVLPGNHDLRTWEGKDYISMLSKWMTRLGISHEIIPENTIIKINNEKILLRHDVGRSSGGYAGGVTGKILNNAKTYLMEFNADKIIVGHYHVFALTDRVILLPSFQYNKDAKYWDRGIIVYFENGTIIPVLTKQKTHYSTLKDHIELKKWYLELLEESVKLYPKGKEEPIF